jgi:hypothetical protein
MGGRPDTPRLRVSGGQRTWPTPAMAMTTTTTTATLALWCSHLTRRWRWRTSEQRLADPRAAGHRLHYFAAEHDYGSAVGVFRGMRRLFAMVDRGCGCTGWRTST